MLFVSGVDNWFLIVDLWSQAPLSIMEMIFLQPVQLWEVELGKNDWLAVKSALKLQEALSNGVDGIFKTVVFWHYVQIVKNLGQVNPILH